MHSQFFTSAYNQVRSSHLPKAKISPKARAHTHCSAAPLGMEHGPCAGLCQHVRDHAAFSATLMSSSYHVLTLDRIQMNQVCFDDGIQPRHLGVERRLRDQFQVGTCCDRHCCCVVHPAYTLLVPCFATPRSSTKTFASGGRSLQELPWSTTCSTAIPAAATRSAPISQHPPKDPFATLAKQRTDWICRGWPQKATASFPGRAKRVLSRFPSVTLSYVAT